VAVILQALDRDHLHVAETGSGCLPASSSYAGPPDGVPSTTMAPPLLLPPGTPTPTPWSPLAGGWDSASLIVAFSTMAITLPLSDWTVDSGVSYHNTSTASMLSRSHPPFLPSLLDRRWEWFHSPSHLNSLNRCLGSLGTVLSQRRSHSSTYYSNFLSVRRFTPTILVPLSLTRLVSL
jgi:hypothetical protein